MGLFKFLKKIFKPTESPKNDSIASDDQLDLTSTETFSLSTKRPSKKLYSKKTLQQPTNLTWQMHKTNPSRETDIVIGFDFGTSCTKVIIQDSVLKKANAVQFGELGCQGNSFLLPTSIAADQKGCLTLKSDNLMPNSLKMKFLQHPDKPIKISNKVFLTATEATCAYIGLVLREIREWFWKEKHSDYKETKIDWQLNIGMSSRSYDDQSLSEQLKRVALAGWNLTLEKVNSINAEEIKKAIESADRQIQGGVLDDEQQLHPDNACPIPEIIAQVIGYVRSPMRQNGMYLIIDIGAATIDVSNFIIYENEGEDIYTILVAEVEKLGASILHQYRIAWADAIINKYNKKNIQSFRMKAKTTIYESYDGILPLPNIEQYFPHLPNEAINAFRRANHEFRAECSRLIRKVIRESKFNRNPLSPAWQKGMPLFICGGGSKIKLYEEVVSHAQNKLYRAGFPGFKTKQLPKPTNLETTNIPPRDYHRMSVAYGLSFPSINIGDIIPPSAIEDLVADEKIRNTSQFFIDKDMV